MKPFPEVNVIGRKIKLMREAISAPLIVQRRRGDTIYDYTSSSPTAKELAKKIGISFTLYSRIESGKRNPSDEILFKILTMGFGIKKEEARKLISSWRIEETNKRYKL